MSSRSSATCRPSTPTSSRFSVNSGGLDPTEDDVAQMPWKYVGYHRYSEFLSSDEDMLIVRRFGTVSTRVLLLLQDKVVGLEQELERFDRQHSGKGHVQYNNGTLRNDLEDREEMLDELAEALSQYNSLLLQHSELRQRPLAALRDIKTIERWHAQYGNNVINPDEMEYLHHHDDLISVVTKDKTPFRRFIDSSHWLRTLPIWRGRDGPDPPPGSEKVVHFSDKSMDRFASGVIAVVGFLMILTPIWILQALDRRLVKLIVISIFILVFLLTMSFTMVAKPFEALGATAAYAAVLMVFLQIDEAG